LKQSRQYIYAETVNDENIQKVLARALVSNQNAGVRLRALNMIGTQSEQKQIGYTRT